MHEFGQTIMSEWGAGGWFLGSAAEKTVAFSKEPKKKHPPFWRLQKLPPAVLEAPLIWACRFGVPFSLETSWLLAPEGRAWASHRIQEANGHMEESKSHGGVFVGAVHYPFWCAFPD